MSYKIILLPRQLTLVYFLIFSISQSFAQTPYPGCPNVAANPTDGSLTFSNDSVYLECGETCTELETTFLETGLTTDYKVESITYAPPFPFYGGSALFINADDRFSDVINLPFDFCFYSNTFNQIVVGANGCISFDVALANGPCDFIMNSSIPSPPPGLFNGGVYGNSINGAFHDMEPPKCASASINYSVLGTYPCRTFVVNFADVCHFGGGCPANQYKTTQQIVIYETTNVIEVYIKDKPSCTAWENGNAYIGIQNGNGTQGIAPPGRNNGAWSASNEAWRFVPDGAPNYIFKWLNEAGIPIGLSKTQNVCLTGNTPETFTAEIEYTNCNGNTIVESHNVVVVPKGQLTATVTSTDALCKDSCNGTATLIPTEGTAPFSITLSDGTAVPGLNLSNLCEGAYTVTLTDALGCASDFNFNVGVPSPVQISFSNEPTSCGSAADGELTITSITGGVAPYTITWDDGESDSTRIGAAGNYSIQVSDFNNCPFEGSGTIISGPELSFTMVALDPSCFGLDDGVIWVENIQEAVFPVSFSWNTGESDSTHAVGAGVYAVELTDNEGCTGLDSLEVFEPPVLELDTSLIHLSCPEKLDGRVQATATGGSAPYEFSFNGAPFSNNSNFPNLNRGKFRLDLKDAKGCTVSLEGELFSDSVSVFVPGDRNLCPGESIVLTATGLFETVLWNNGVVDGAEYFPNHEGAKEFIATARNSSGCEASDTLLIVMNPEYDPTIIPSGPFCTSDLDVVIATNEPNGFWIGGADNMGVFSPAGAGEGTHEVIYAFHGTCPTSDTIYIDVNDNFDAAINPVSPFCILAGEIVLTSVTNGGKWYGAGISDDNFPNFDPILAGEGAHWVYHLIDNTCGDYDSILVEVIKADTAQIKPIDDMCWDGEAVQFEATPEGGTWSGTEIALDGNFNPFLGGTGAYSATYTPDGTCIIIDVEDFTVGDTLKLEPDTFYLACFSDTNATVVTGVTGGYDNNYSYTWGSGVSNSGPTAFNLASGNYTVAVSDGLGCTESTNHEVIAPPGMAFTKGTESTPPFCPNSCDGAAQIYVAGGEALSDYQYSLEQGLGSIDGNGLFSGLCAGLTIVKIADDNGCYLLDSINLVAPSSLQIYGGVLTAHCDLADGNISIDSVTGGAGNYTYAWNTGTSGATLNNISAGTYTVVVTDENGCSQSKTFDVPNEVGPTVSVVAEQTTCFNGNDGQIIAFPLNGNAPYTYNWSSGSTDSIAANLVAQTYTLEITDVNGCKASTSGVVLEPTKVVMDPISDILLCVDQEATVSLNASGGNGPAYSFNSDLGSVAGNTLNSSTPGNHSLFATDNKGCISDPVYFNLNCRDPISLVISPNDTLCPGSNKNLFILAQGGIENFQFQWSTGETSSEIVFSSNMSGINDTISVLVSDGCSPEVSDFTILSYFPDENLNYSVLPNEGCEPLFTQFSFDKNDVSEVQFNPGNGAPRLNGLQFPFSYPEAGNYIPEINFMSSNGCAQHQILDTILVHPIPNGEIMVSPNALNIVFSKAELLLSADVELASAEWLAISEGDTLFPGSDPNVEVTFPADVRVWEISNVFTSVFGCVNSTEKVIKIHPNSTIYAPSGFTPDGDYINDVFKISYSGVELQGFEVHIYDRWGIIVFSSKDPNFEWDGRIKGEQRKMDTYAWVIKYFEQEDIRKSLSGKITLLR